MMLLLPLQKGYQMRISISKKQLAEYVSKQISVLLPDGTSTPKIENTILTCLDTALERSEFCFSKIGIPGYHDEQGQVIFSHLHMDEYATFLYFLGNTVWKRYGDGEVCSKILNLNRILNGFFVSYKCALPDYFIFAHPIGSIIGNANYGEGIYFSQSVTIETNPDLLIGRHVFLGPGVVLTGSGRIGNNVSLGANVLLSHPDIEDNKVVLNQDGKMVVRDRIKEVCQVDRILYKGETI